MASQIFLLLPPRAVCQEMQGRSPLVTSRNAGRIAAAIPFDFASSYGRRRMGAQALAVVIQPSHRGRLPSTDSKQHRNTRQR